MPEQAKFGDNPLSHAEVIKKFSGKIWEDCNVLYKYRCDLMDSKSPGSFSCPSPGLASSTAFANYLFYFIAYFIFEKFKYIIM